MSTEYIMIIENIYIYLKYFKWYHQEKISNYSLSYYWWVTSFLENVLKMKTTQLHSSIGISFSKKLKNSQVQIQLNDN